MRVVKNTFENIQNSFNRQSYCISLDMSANSAIDVSENTFNQVGSLFSANSGTGIRIRNVNSSTVNIIGNTFNTLQGTHGDRAIALLNGTSGTPANTTFVQGNTIRNMRTGIHLVNYDKATVNNLQSSYNYITLPDALPASGSYYGIKLDRSNKNTIQRNTVKRPDPAADPNFSYQTRVFGISVETSLANFVSDNNVRKNGSGIRFMNSGSNAVQCNELYHNFDNIRLESSNIGNQGTPAAAQDNQWYMMNLSSEMCIRGVGVTYSADWFAQQIWPPYLPPNVYVDPLSVYFFPPGVQNNCSIAPARIGKQEEMAAIVMEEGDFELLSDDEQYNLKRSVYITIYEDNTWFDLGTSYDAVLQQFYDSTSAGTLGQLIAAQAATITDTSLASSILFTVAPENNAEENERTVLEVYLNTVAKNNFEFNEEQSNILYSIAIQHPVSGGEAVYSARAMLDLFVDDKIIETAQRFSKPLNFTRYLERTCKVYPNPANDFLNFIVTLPVGVNGEITILSIGGNREGNYELTAGYNNIKMDAKQLSAGIYFYHMTTTDNEIQRGKFIISK